MARRQTVLVEHADGATRWAAERSLRREGYDVVTCPGPSSHRDCPALTRGECDLLDRADQVLNGISGRAGEALMQAQRSRQPIRVTRLDPAPSRHGRITGDRFHLVAALDHALRRERGPEVTPDRGEVTRPA
jgi:hypothetical protein